MRNPLAGVESYTQLLEGEISGEPGRTYLRALEQSEQRLHFLTESFIKMARLEQQMIQIKKTTDALADTIFSAVLLVQKAAEEKQMEVEPERKRQKCGMMGTGLARRSIIYWTTA